MAEEINDIAYEMESRCVPRGQMVGWTAPLLLLMCFQGPRFHHPGETNN